MSEIKKYIVEEELASNRLDKVVKVYFEDLSRAFIQTLIENENILVNDTCLKANYRCKVGDVITINIPAEEELDVIAEDIPIDIVYEDGDIIVVNKPNGMVVHPSAGHENKTLVNALLYHTKFLSGINGILRPGIVHRIDKETTGLLLVAKNDKAHKHLSEQLQNKSIDRIYTGIVSGVITHESGTIDAPIGRSENDRKKMGINPKGKEAKTNFKVLKRWENHTLVEFKLETGRTHQIRVHMKYINHPLLGDATYGHRKEIDKNFGQYLHAYKLKFVHPITDEVMEFECALPKEFETKFIELDS